jgi:carbon storage regulator
VLVLTRNEDESVFIGDDIEVIVVGVLGDGRVRLGFKAPRDIPIERDNMRKGRRDQQVPGRSIPRMAV